MIEPVDDRNTVVELEDKTTISSSDDATRVIEDSDAVSVVSEVGSYSASFSFQNITIGALMFSCFTF